MSSAVKLAGWVEKKPLILVHFDEHSSERLLNSKNGLKHFTIARPHSVFRRFKLPTICLLHIQTCEGRTCYLATATRKAAVSTFDSCLTIKELHAIAPSSLHEIAGKFTDRRLRKSFESRLPKQSGFSRLSPKVSANLVELLARDPNNHDALDIALSLLPGLRRLPDTNWAQVDAIHRAMEVFGIRAHQIPDDVLLKHDTFSALGMIGSHNVYEENVIRADASQIPGFEAIVPDITGRAVFDKGDERLVIYTANRLPLEQMFGVDLIYVNETRGNVVMIQYKMLEEHHHNGKNRDWLFRPNQQFWTEIARMSIPSNSERECIDYRLTSNPFFFKFVKRKHVGGDSPTSFLISLEHLTQFLASSEGRGPSGGVRLSYDALDGTYLRNSDMIGLIRSGYVGTHRAETEALASVISEGARGNKAVVLAWQRRIHGDVSIPS